MVKKIVLFLSLCVPGLAYAQRSNGIVGSWKGTLSVGVELPLVFNISQEKNGILSATLDSPDQRAFGIPCDSVSLNGNLLFIGVKSIRASYSGKMVNDSTIRGNFNQGTDLPLELKRSIGVQEKIQTAPLFPHKEMELNVNGAYLSGTLVQPDPSKDIPVVLIIAGSGPTDRDGNTLAMPGRNNSLLLLGDSLAAHGIASLRYDKRGIGKSKMPEGYGEEKIVIDDIANDAKAMFNWLKKEGYSKIYIAGHSEGSLIGVMIAPQVNPSGFISIAGAGRKATEILEEQLSAGMTPEQVARFRSASDSIMAGLTVNNVEPGLQSLLRPSIQPYLRSWFALDPKALIATLKCPVLIIQGTNDIQVLEKDANELHAGKPDAQFVLVKGMNHVLKLVASDDIGANLGSYSNPFLPLPRELISSIVEFVKTGKAKK